MPNAPHRCDLCSREVPRLTRHHLIPKTRHHNRKNKKLFAREEVHTRIALLCRPCHGTVHAVLTEKELEREYNTLERLAAHPEIAKFVAWVRAKPAGLRVTVRHSKNRSH